MIVRRFESSDHPGNLPKAVVFSRALVLPLAAAMLPVMIATLVAVLEGLPILPHSLWAAGAAGLLSAAWTSFNLRRRVAEIRIEGPWVQVRSVADVALQQTDPPKRVLDVRNYGSWAHLTVGLTSFELERAEWPAFDELVEALAISRAR